MLPFELRAVEVALNGAVQVRVPYPHLSHRGRGPSVAAVIIIVVAALLVPAEEALAEVPACARGGAQFTR